MSSLKCKVRGEVKEDEFTIDKAIYAISYKDVFFEALEDPKQKDKLNAKDAITIFKKKHYDGASNTTLLEYIFYNHSIFILPLNIKYTKNR